MSAPHWDAIGSIGSTSLGVVALYYIFTFLVPEILKRFASELETQRTAFKDELTTCRKTHEAVAERIASSVDQHTADVTQALKDTDATIKALGELVIRHDATVRGQNPATTGSHEELRKQWRDAVEGEGE